MISLAWSLGEPASRPDRQGIRAGSPIGLCIWLQRSRRVSCLGSRPLTSRRVSEIVEPEKEVSCRVSNSSRRLGVGTDHETARAGRGGAGREGGMSAAIDVCEGCRRLRKRCDKDNCILHPCLESLWPNSRQSQGNATVFLAKYFGRKRFFKLLEAVTSQQRAELFESLLHEACGRTVNPLGGATGLLRLNRWAECQAAVVTVLNGESLRPVPSAPSTPPTINNDDPVGEPITVVEPIAAEDLIKVEESAKVEEPAAAS